MTTPLTAAYQRLVVLFGRMKYSGVGVAVLGAVVGLGEHGAPRFVIWVVAGVLAIWLFLAGHVEQRLYARRVVIAERIEADAAASGRSTSRDPTAVATFRRRYECLFTGAMFAGLVISAAGIVVGLSIRSDTAALVLGGLGAVGLWLVAMALVVRKGIRRMRHSAADRDR